MGAERPLVVVGVLGTPHGLRGELHARFHNPDSDLLRPGLSLIVRRGAERQPRELRNLRQHGKGFLVQLSGCSGRDQAEALRGAELCVERQVLPPLEEDEFYLVDLVGLVAVDAGGTRVGEVTDTIEYPASQVICVRSARGLLEVPLLEPYLVRVDVEGGQVVLDRLEDLEPVKGGDA